MPPDTQGQWSATAPLIPVPDPTIDDGHGHSLTDARGLFVLHAMLLKTGKVLWFSGHVELAYYAPLCYLFDPDHPTATLSPIPFPPDADLFCCHYVQVADGRIVAAGGSELHDHTQTGFDANGSTGARTIAFFDPDTERWDLSRKGASPNKLKQGRWYPTLVNLPDGRVAVFSGRREAGSGVPAPHIADMVEILGPPDWDSKELTGAARALPIYPGLHLAPNGRIYFTHTTWGQEMPDPETMSIEITSGATSAAWTTYAGRKPTQPHREEGMSVLLPPAQDGKILVIGGSRALNAAGQPLLDPTTPAAGFGPPHFDHIEVATDPFSAEILDTTVTPPTWSDAAPAPQKKMTHGRTNGHCVLLPDSTVLILGGHDKYKWKPKPTTEPSLNAEIFKLGVGFTDVTETLMKNPRMYHSAALLVPDGSVVIVGGADPNRSEPVLTYPPGWVGRTYPSLPLNDKSFETYQPPYFFKGPRPKIVDVLRGGSSTRRIEHGQKFTVKTLGAASIAKVAFMRPGCVTHHTDTEQRYVKLDFTRGSGELTVTAVSDPKLAPPGYYMLWIIDDQDRPCERAVFVRLLPHGTSCFVATATLGSPAHPGVLYLQELRRELSETGALGRRFIQMVNRAYEAFSPRLARYLARDPLARAAVRDVVVRPAIGSIAAADRVARRCPTRGTRQMALVSLLALEGAATATVAPLLLALVGGRMLAGRMRGRRRRPPEPEVDGDA